MIKTCLSYFARQAYIRAFETEYASGKQDWKLYQLVWSFKNEIQGAADRLLTCIHREDEEPMKKAG